MTFTLLPFKKEHRESLCFLSNEEREPVYGAAALGSPAVTGVSTGRAPRLAVKVHMLSEERSTDWGFRKDVGTTGQPKGAST